MADALLVFFIFLLHFSFMFLLKTGRRKVKMVIRKKKSFCACRLERSTNLSAEIREIKTILGYSCEVTYSNNLSDYN